MVSLNKNEHSALETAVAAAKKHYPALTREFYQDEVSADDLTAALRDLPKQFDDALKMLEKGAELIAEEVQTGKKDIISAKTSRVTQHGIEEAFIRQFREIFENARIAEERLTSRHSLAGESLINSTAKAIVDGILQDRGLGGASRTYG